MPSLNVAHLDAVLVLNGAVDLILRSNKRANSLQT